MLLSPSRTLSSTAVCLCSVVSCCLSVLTLPYRGNALLEVEGVLWIVLTLDLLEPGKVVAVVGPEVVDAAVGHVDVGPFDVGPHRRAESLDPRDGLFLPTGVLPWGVPLHVVACLPVKERRVSGRYSARRPAPAQAPYIGLVSRSVRKETAYRLDCLR